jgi:exodeoxyribonuclease VII large subunit
MRPLIEWNSIGTTVAETGLDWEAELVQGGPLSVSGVTAYLQALIEEDPQLQQLWIVGEVSSANPHSSGLFLTLQDPSDRSSIQAVVWKSQLGRLTTVPRVGDLVLLLGRMRIYGTRSQYQLVVWQCLPAGEGLRSLRDKQLRDRLTAEGLFDRARKRPLPIHPQTIAVVTSPNAAAWGDIQRTLVKRYPGLRVLLSPATVQGDRAAESIAAAIERVEIDGRAELLILSRGGGATEDLACFNDERVVRAVAFCNIPVISGIGHERDDCLADLAADFCAHTPTAAAAAAVPLLSDLVELYEGELMVLRSAMARQLMRAEDQLSGLHQRLQRQLPDRQLTQEKQRLSWLQRSIVQAMGQRLGDQQQQLARLDETLMALDPTAVLRRGYAVVRRELAVGADRPIVRDADHLKPGDRIAIQLGRGQIQAQVLQVDTEERSDPS